MKWAVVNIANISHKLLTLEIKNYKHKTTVEIEFLTLQEIFDTGRYLESDFLYSNIFCFNISLVFYSEYEYFY